jgi:hypothetical protein
MLATSPSPNISPTTTRYESTSPLYASSPRSHYDRAPAQSIRTWSATADQESISRKRTHSSLSSTRSLDHIRSSPRSQPRPKMVDASTQYSPPNQQKVAQTPTSTIAGLHLSEQEVQVQKSAPLPVAARQTGGASSGLPRPKPDSPVVPKRQAADVLSVPAPEVNGISPEEPTDSTQSPTKKAKPESPPVRIMPPKYEDCNTRDLVVLIASMLMELIRYNDAIPLKEGGLTRFHSRAPPGISVLDYLQRLTTHATLSPPILLSLVYYIDRLCAIYPAFTISSLTVHRFLITSATVASKGLSDAFWTNKVYARVGGVSMKELALLELEFLFRMEWRIVPKPEVLVDYYKSLIARNSGYQLEAT